MVVVSGKPLKQSCKKQWFPVSQSIECCGLVHPPAAVRILKPDTCWTGLGFGTLAAALPTGGVATGAVEMVPENGVVYHKDDHFDIENWRFSTMNLWIVIACHSLFSDKPKWWEWWSKMEFVGGTTCRKRWIWWQTWGVPACFPWTNSEWGNIEAAAMLLPINWTSNHRTGSGHNSVYSPSRNGKIKQGFQQECWVDRWQFLKLQ